MQNNTTKGKNSSLIAIVLINAIGIPALIIMLIFTESFYYEYIMPLLMIILIVTNIAVLSAIYWEKRYTDLRSELFEHQINGIKKETKDWGETLEKINKLLDEKRIVKIENLYEALKQAFKETGKEHYIEDIDDIHLTKLRLIELIKKIERKW